jgi:hypothetical protein
LTGKILTIFIARIGGASSGLFRDRRPSQKQNVNRQDYRQLADDPEWGVIQKKKPCQPLDGSAGLFHDPEWGVIQKKKPCQPPSGGWLRVLFFISLLKASFQRS